MDDLKDKIAKLKKLQRIIPRMRDNILKAKMIAGYTDLLGYVREAYNLDENECATFDLEIEDITKSDRHIVKSTNKRILEFEKVALYLYEQFDLLIKEYKKYNFCSFLYENYQKIDKKQIDRLLSEFFYTLDKEVYNIYHKMSDENNIFMSLDCGYLGASMDTKNIDNSCIILQAADNYMDFYFTLAHEIGHCYQFYLQRNQLFLESFNIIMEVTSLLFEKLFRNFLAKKSLYPNEIKGYDLEDHIYFLNDISASKVLCGLFNDSSIRNIDAYNLSYETPFEIDDLLGMMACDCGYIMPNKLDLSLTELHYSIGNIIANHFLKKIEEDFKSGWQEFKNFLCTVNYLPIEEVLIKYLDIPLMKENIKKYMKSYQGR